MFDHALLALDLSPAGEDMIETISALMALGVRTCTLVHVDRIQDDPLEGPVAAHPRAVLADYEGRARAAASRAGAAAGADTGADARAGGEMEIRTDPRLGEPAAEILRAAAECGASLIVMGTRSRSRIAEAFMGSVARDVLETSSVPVLLLHVAPDGHLHERSKQGFSGRILCVTDFSETADRAFDLALELASPARLPVTVLHATPWALGEDVKAEGALEEMGERLRSAHVPGVQTLIAHQTPAHAILATAETEAPSLLVMGTQGRGFLGRMVLGSVSREVAQTWTGPLLLVPPKHP
jgi:nucleotide-binding universal stress UspA family protein